ncbi:hypothetical protein LTR85_003332 [Meristemomyces frigidus]|nr:hypothetical protein LTR85_003332 [Meristemomyces frigidus]
MADVMVQLDNMSPAHKVAHVRTFKGLEHCTEEVALYVWNRSVKKARKLKGYPKLQANAVNIQNGIWAMHDEIHDYTEDHKIKRKLDIAGMRKALDFLEQCIDEKDKEKLVRKTGPVTPLPHYSVVHVDSEELVEKMISKIIDYHHPYAETPTLYVDLEGENLGRNGDVAIMQIFAPKTDTVYILHIHLLGEAAFSTAGGPLKATTFRSILESRGLVKAFWDCSADSDALFSHYSIRLDPDGVLDLQILECASTKDKGKRKSLMSLTSAVHRRTHLPRDQDAAWRTAKTEGHNAMQRGPNWREEEQWAIRKAEFAQQMMWATSAGARVLAKAEYDAMVEGEQAQPEKVKVWEEYPLRPEMLEYAVGDVTVMPILYHNLATHPRLTPEGKKAVLVETAKRIMESQAEELKPSTGNKVPDGWAERGWCEGGDETSIAVLPSMKLGKEEPTDDGGATETTPGSAGEGEPGCIIRC